MKERTYYYISMPNESSIKFGPMQRKEKLILLMKEGDVLMTYKVSPAETIAIMKDGKLEEVS